ncbi:MAG: GGDEF domain-containing protein [Gammaproteobacteria bacterium]|nr:GGDEF domain-containing protein [Gammaproteobacteria bacterium]
MPALESRIEILLHDPAASPADLHAALAVLYERYCLQEQMLARLIHISDKYQMAERERGLSHVEQLQRKVRQVEKIVRISDGYQSMLQDLHTRLTAISNHDDLTGLPNRRHMQERLKQTIAQAERNGDTVSIALVDIDFFKKINDSAGHAIGDVVLTRVAECMRQSMREYDICARWGGEEFLMLFPSCDLQNAAQLAERARAAVAKIPTDDLHAGLNLSVSIGYTEFRLGEAIDSTLKRADDALYCAKSSGRNCVIGSSASNE